MAAMCSLKASIVAGGHHVACQNLKGMLHGWLASAGVEWHERGLHLSGPRGCIRVLATEAVPAGTPLARIPKAAVLSLLTGVAGGALAAEGLGGGAALTVAVAVELLRGRRSAWAGYLASCPECEPLPVWWGEEALRLARGTGLAEAAAAEREALEQDYCELAHPFLLRHGAALQCSKGGWRAAFMSAASLVSSRAFFVDEEHGDALVPFADALNHRSAILELGCGVVIEGHGATDGAEAQHHHQHADGVAAQWPLGVAICNRPDLDALVVLAQQAMPAGCEVLTRATPSLPAPSGRA